MKIAHESPIEMMGAVRGMTDYDYALGHMFHNQDYFNFFVDSLRVGREVILDNGLYELGKPMNEPEFVEQIEKLKPTYYIVPDHLHDWKKTVNAADQWQKYKGVLPGKQMAVVQGTTYEELVECYSNLDRLVEKVAFNFLSPVYAEAGHTAMKNLAGYDQTKHKLVANATGRMRILARMVLEGVINTNKPHHLLGCTVPNEFGFYSGYEWLDTIDTSNPVVYAINGGDINKYGTLTTKSSKMVADMLDIKCTNRQIAEAGYCIAKFKHMTSQFTFTQIKL